jgi:hypothetical protein
MMRLIPIFVVFSPFLGAQSVIEIVEPANSAIIRPGDNVVVNVRTGTAYAKLWVDGDRELKIKPEIPSGPPYRFTVPIPADIVGGRYRLWAVGCGNQGPCEQMDPIIFDVEPIWPDTPPSVTDDPGITVGTGGVPVKRPAVVYPNEAIATKIGGTVVVEVTPDWEGHVEGVQVISGPLELQKDVIKDVLTWQFPRLAGRKPRQIGISFDPYEAARARSERQYQQPSPATSTRAPASATGGKAQSPPTLTPARIRVPAAIQAAKLISKVDPVYPQLARLNHFQGVVGFTAILNPDGSVQNLLLVKGNPWLVEAARKAASQWRYSPTVVNGMPVEVVTDIEVEFFLLN